MSLQDQGKCIKITEIIPYEYEDFLIYCKLANKVFSDEISQSDYVAYRNYFMRSKNDVKCLREIIDASVQLNKSNENAKNFPTASANFKTTDEDFPFESKHDDLPQLSERLDLYSVSTNDSTKKIEWDPSDKKHTYAKILGLDADKYGKIDLERNLYIRYSILLSTRSLNALRRAKCFSIKDVLLLTPFQLRDIRNLGTKTIEEIESTLILISDKPLGDFVENAPTCSSDSQITDEGFSFKSEHDDLPQLSDRQVLVSDANNDFLKKIEWDPSDKNHTYANILGVDTDKYENMYLERDLNTRYSFSLSTRSLNALRRAKCFSVKDIFLLTPFQLHDIRNLGAKTADEIESSLLLICEKDEVRNKRSRCNFLKSQIRSETFRPVIEAFLNEEPYSTEKLNATEKETYDRLFEAAEIFGYDYCREMLLGLDHLYIEVIIDTFSDFSSAFQIKQNIIKRGKAAVLSWNQDLLSKRFSPYLQIFLHTKNNENAKKLESIFDSDNMLVGQYVQFLDRKINTSFEGLKALPPLLDEFQQWMSGIDLNKIAAQIFNENMGSCEKTYTVLTMRASGQTLENVASRWCVTRERIRQIEFHGLRVVKKRFFNNDYNLIELISAWYGGKYFLTLEDIEKVIDKEYADLLWYCATRKENQSDTYFIDGMYYAYDKPRNRIILQIGKGGLEPLIEEEKLNKILAEVFSSTPDLIRTDELNERLKIMSTEYDMPYELFEQESTAQYKKSGLYSYRGRITVLQKCDIVLKERFQNGYKIADETDGNLFLKYLDAMFGEGSKSTIRAIDSKIMDIGVMIDRGKYIHRDYIHVDQRVVKKIFSYVKASPKTALTYAEIYAGLEEQLKGTQITNRYILQGVMKLYNSPFQSHRDYITKNRNGSVADELSEFVRANGIVHKNDILAEFPGWKDYNITFVLPRCPDVFSIDNGYYMHASGIKIDKKTRTDISKYLNDNIREIPVSARFLQNEFMIRFPDFMIENDIQTHGKLFGFLQHMFSTRFYFSRPYISREKAVGITNKSVLLRHLEGIDSIEISDLLELCDQAGINYIGQTYLVDWMQPDFIRINKTTLMRLTCTGFEQEMLSQVAELISEVVDVHNGYVASSRINDFSWYPVLNIPWTTFLLESISNMLPEEVHTIKIPSTSMDVPHAIFVCDEYAEEDWNSLVVRLLKAEHEAESFRSKDDIFEWLRAEGLCNVKYPAFLDSENHVYTDEEGRLRVE